MVINKYEDSENNKKILLRGKHLTKRMGGVMAVKNCSISLAENCITGIFGPPASGKTTLMKMLCGLMQPNEGDVYIRGRKPSYKTNEFVSYLPEQPFVNYQTSVESLLDIYDRFFTDFRYTKAVKLLKHFDIDCFSHMDMLTPTEIQLVETIMVICRKADVYIFDEPVLNVEKSYRKPVIQMIETCRSSGAVVLTSEITDGFDDMLDRIMFMSTSEIRLSCTADEFERTYEESVSSVYGKMYGQRKNV